jgi:hypothetical protein
MSPRAGLKDGKTSFLVIITSDIDEWTDKETREKAADGSYSVEMFADELEARARFVQARMRTNMDVILVKVLDRAEGQF